MQPKHQIFIHFGCHSKFRKSFFFKQKLAPIIILLLILSSQNQLFANLCRMRVKVCRSIPKNEERCDREMRLSRFGFS